MENVGITISMWLVYPTIGIRNLDDQLDGKSESPRISSIDFASERQITHRSFFSRMLMSRCVELTTMSSTGCMGMVRFELQLHRIFVLYDYSIL